MTKKWNCEKALTKQVIENFIKTYSMIDYVDLDRLNILLAFSLSSKYNHDIYYSYYLACAIKHGCQEILTTDQDFDKLCSLLEQDDFPIEYNNPVPLEILKKFVSYNK
jgi:predicted nucleic acid-binding protein